MIQAVSLTTTVPEWFVTFESLKEECLTRAQNLTQAEQQRAPSPGTWSVSQAIEHLIAMEKTFIGQAQRTAVLRLKNKPGAKGRIIVAAVGILVRLGLRIPTTADLNPHPQPHELSELASEWDKCRIALRTMVIQNSENSIWISHPVFGPMSSETAGKFLVTHINYHLKHLPTSKA